METSIEVFHRDGLSMILYKYGYIQKNSYLEFLSRRREKPITVYQTFPYGGDKLRYQLKLTLEVYEKLFVSLDATIEGPRRSSVKTCKRKTKKKKIYR